MTIVLALVSFCFLLVAITFAVVASVDMEKGNDRGWPYYAFCVCIFLCAFLLVLSLATFILGG